MSTTIILKCLLRRAQVFEVFEDGSTLKLNLSNYYTDNTNAVKSTPATKVITPQTVNMVPANVVIEDDIKQDEEIVDNYIESEECSTSSEIEETDEDESDNEDADDEETGEVDNCSQQNTNNQNYNKNKKRKQRH